MTIEKYAEYDFTNCDMTTVKHFEESTKTAKMRRLHGKTLLKVLEKSVQIIRWLLYLVIAPLFVLAIIGLLILMVHYKLK